MDLNRSRQTIINALTIDLEDYFMVSAFETVVAKEQWRNYESRIERSTHRVLDILDAANGKHGVKATFFCLGWVGERYRPLIREIDRRGHEIACHGYDHRLVYRMTPEQFREDVRVSKRILEDAAGHEVIGYRAPSYSITEKSLWALGILGEEGYRYDSSIFPIHHDRYGIPAAPRFPFLVRRNGDGVNGAPVPARLDQMPPWKLNRGEYREDGIVEYPISTVKVLGCNIPLSGGGYMRLFPYGMIRKGLLKINADEEQPFVFYLHPWEFDPEQPRMTNASILSRFRHYVNLGETAGKLQRLLGDFRFSPMADVIGLR